MSTTADVMNGQARWGADCSDALAWLKPLPDRCVNLVLFSPPYEDQRTYGIGVKAVGQAWVDWMRAVVVEAARVSAGLVVVNAAGPVRGGSYSPSMEWLTSDLTRLDGLVCGPSPWCWHKACGIPGSGAKHYQRRDWEPLYGYCLPDRLPLSWSDNTAFGKPPKYGPGGEFSTRKADGSRVNDPWNKRRRGNGVGGRTVDGKKKLGTLAGPHAPGPSRRANGQPKAVARDGPKKTIRQPSGRMEETAYAPPKIANPGNVILARVGGNRIGHPLAHESEAPMSLALAERFVCWYAPPDGIVADPFTGSGTTAHAAILHGRRFVGCDVRQSQVDLTGRRMATVTPNLFGT